MESERETSLHREIEETETASNAVVEAVCAMKGVEMTDLSPLTRTIDSDALDAVYDTMGPEGRISFEYEGINVIVSGAGTVSVRETTDDPTES